MAYTGMLYCRVAFDLRSGALEREGGLPGGLSLTEAEFIVVGYMVSRLARHDPNEV